MQIPPPVVREDSGCCVILETGCSELNRRMLVRFAARAQAAVGLKGEVNVLVAGNARLRVLNRAFRGKDKPTDVLSFPARKPTIRDKSMTEARPTDGRGIHSGDIAISAEMALRQARALRHSLQDELKVLILHGMLHLAGYDHESDRGEMEKREKQLRRRLRLSTALPPQRRKPHRL